MSRLLVSLIKVYQYSISPFLGPRCRFSPSCSEYASQALNKYGLVKGGWLGAKRICRCNPWHEGGHDPLH